MSDKYNIIRFYADSNKQRKIMYKGLSLDEAKAYCSLESTRLAGVWFEGFEAQWIVVNALRSLVYGINGHKARLVLFTVCHAWIKKEEITR